MPCRRSLVWRMVNSNEYGVDIAVSTYLPDLYKEIILKGTKKYSKLYLPTIFKGEPPTHRCEFVSNTHEQKIRTKLLTVQREK